jgi:hypothetical protein
MEDDMPRIGDKVATALKKKGVPPVVLQVQPTSFVMLSKPEELRQWQDDLLKFHGVKMDAAGMAGVAAETCSAGCSDACDMV